MELERVRSHKYTVEEVDTALLTLSRAGSSRLASEHLASIGIEITPERLRSMRNKEYPNRYAHLQAQHGAELDQLIVQNSRAAFLQAAVIEERVLDRLEDNIEKLDARDLPAAAKNLTTVKAINLDKHMLATGRPTQITEHRDAASLLAQLGDVVNSTATDLHDETPEH